MGQREKIKKGKKNILMSPLVKGTHSYHIVSYGISCHLRSMVNVIRVGQAGNDRAEDLEVVSAISPSGMSKRRGMKVKMHLFHTLINTFTL
jgi:hypothetical protein